MQSGAVLKNFAIALALAGCALYAQVDTGAILGTVADQSGGVIPNVKVTLINEGTGLVNTTTTEANGSYVFSPVRIGTYSLSATLPGFQRAERTHLTLDIQQQLKLNLTLVPGEVTQTVEVTGTPAALQTENASVGQVVDSKRVNDLPVNGRNYIFLAQLTTGITVGQQDSRGENNNGRFSSNGARPTQNNFLLDGIDNNSWIDSRQNGKDFVVQTPIDAIAEFKVQTSNYSAEFGRGAGAVLNATIKSGTNQLHGDLWEFLRNDKLDATDFFANAGGRPKSEFRQNQFGGTVGGPVYIPKVFDGRNKAFWFFDYEGLRVRQGNTFLSTVPTQAERDSGFTNFSALTAGLSGSRTDALGRSFPTGTIFDPATTRTLPAGGSVREPFPGNIIPASRLDPNAVKLLSILPAPNGPGVVSNYTSAPVFQNGVNSFDGRFDYSIGTEDQFFARYSYSNINRIRPGPFPGFADGSDSLNDSTLRDRSQNAVVNETHVFSPTLVNVARVGISREHALFIQPFATQTGVAQQFGIQGVPQVAQNGGLPEFVVGSLTRFGSFGFIPSDKYGTVKQIMDDLTKVAGRHTVKTGIEYQHINNPWAQPPAGRGFFTFDGSFTSVVNQTDPNTAIAQLLLAPAPGSNLAGASQVQISAFAPHNTSRNYFGSYVQDDWKFNSKLTLNIGMRWDYYGAEQDRHGDQSNFVPSQPFHGATLLVTAARQDLFPAAYKAALAKDGIDFQVLNRLALFQAQKKNFAPRVGIAYQIFPKLVIRTGYGIFFGGLEEIGGSPDLGENFPFDFTQTFRSPNATTPITANNSIGLLGNSFQNIVLDPKSVNIAGIDLRGQQYKMQTPYSQNYNFTLEYQISPSTIASAAYVGSTARHIPANHADNRVNQILPPGVNVQNFVPFPDFARDGIYTAWEGSSNYNSLQAKIERRFAAGLNLLGAYTWAKGFSDAADPLENGGVAGYRAPDLPGFGIHHDYGLTSFDVRHALHFSGGYELPVGRNSRGLVKQAIGGWSVNWIVTLQTGQPVTIPCSLATAAGLGCYALLVPGQSTAGNRGPDQFFNPAAFANPAVATAIGQNDYSPLGGAPTQVSGPPFRRFDLSLFKQFPIKERTRFEFRAEFFNLTNTPNFALPSMRNFTDTRNFGRITATRDNPNDPREIQFALKFYF